MLGMCGARNLIITDLPVNCGDVLPPSTGARQGRCGGSENLFPNEIPLE